MSIVAFYTNLSSDEIPDSFLLDTSIFFTKQLGKPEQFMTVRVHPNQKMIHGGSTDPCASVEVYSIGNLGSRNKDHAREIATFIQDKLKIPQNRFFVTFFDLKRENVGYQGKTFD